jgi:hypothetical protein
MRASQETQPTGICFQRLMNSKFHTKIGYPLREGWIDDIWMNERKGHSDTDMGNPAGFPM